MPIRSDAKEETARLVRNHLRAALELANSHPDLAPQEGTYGHIWDALASMGVRVDIWSECGQWEGQVVDGFIVPRKPIYDLEEALAGGND